MLRREARLFDVDDLQGHIILELAAYKRSLGNVAAAAAHKRKDRGAEKSED